MAQTPTSEETQPRTPWHVQRVMDSVTALQSDLTQGLTITEAQARLDRYGPNALEEKGGRGPWQKGAGAKLEDRARDTRLDRVVAINVLPDVFAADADRLARFTREAQTLAALNHPHIAQIYGIEHHALVMELVEGEDLGAVIARGPVLLADALPSARQIAEALEAAHDLGIIHRDLKPANIKIRSDGTVKVLDFGLAKAMDPASSGAQSLTNSPTLTGHATQLGMILGTAAYMAPEQARGKAVDRRADIWAFGVVLFEMLTGRRLFAGDEVTDVLAAVLRQDIDWNALPAATPPRLRRLLERCLDRDVKQRLRDIGEARVEIAKIESGAPDSVSGVMPAAVMREPSWRRALPWALAGVSMLVATAERAGGMTLFTSLLASLATPATLNGVPMAAGPERPQAESLIVTGFAYDKDVRARQAQIVASMVSQVRDVRRMGSAALDLAWLAAGRYDAYYERTVKLWDIAAGSLLVERVGLEVRELPARDGMPWGIAAGRANLLDALWDFRL